MSVGIYETSLNICTQNDILGQQKSLTEFFGLNFKNENLKQI